MKLWTELRRRRVFRLAGLYMVGAWLVIEVSSVFFPAWGIPDTALRYLFVAAALLFPVAIVFAWIFDITPAGIIRTKEAGPAESVDTSLKKTDYAVLGALAVIAASVIYGSLQQVADETHQEAPSETEARVENSIAVLPFSNLDANPDTGYFSDGVTEEILHRLSATRALHVLGRTSSFAFRDTQEGPAQISELLGVEYLLHGSIRRDGDWVRVTARLMDEAGLQVWSQTFDRKLEAIFVIQSEIASSVVSQIVREIVSSGGMSAASTTSNMDAYNEYLVGKTLIRTRTPGWREPSQAAFLKAIELDPDFAPAYAGYAYSLMVMASDQAPERVEPALAAAKRSLELNADLAEGHAMLGFMEGFAGTGNPGEWEQRLRRAIELDPALSDAYNWLFILLQDAGRLAEADAVLEQAYWVDPLFPTIAANYANLILANRGDYEGAMRVLEPFTRLPQLSNAIRSALVEVNAGFGRFAAAIRHAGGAEAPVLFEVLGLSDIAAAQLADLGEMWPYGRTMHWRDYLQVRGEYVQRWERFAEFINEHDFVFSEIDPLHQGLVIETQALGGDFRGAITRFEGMGDGDPYAAMEDIPVLLVPEVLNAIGFAYLQTGDEAAARSVLSYRTQRLLHFEPWLSPVILGPMALNAALLGDTDLAYERLSLAVEKGWADYYRAINDPRWGGLLAEPRFAELLERVREYVEAQRAEVQAMLENSPG